VKYGSRTKPVSVEGGIGHDQPAFGRGAGPFKAAPTSAAVLMAGCPIGSGVGGLVPPAGMFCRQ